jgi:hypothetical protein
MDEKSDVLYCPIQNETEFLSVKEIYGKTKISGNIGDAIRYAKPAIFPTSYESDLEFIIPEKEDLQTQLSEVKIKDSTLNYTQGKLFQEN